MILLHSQLATYRYLRISKNYLFLRWYNQNVSCTKTWEVQQLKIVLLYVVTQVLVCRRWVFDGSSYSVPEFLVVDAAFSALAAWGKFLREERLEVRCVLVGHVQLLARCCNDSRSQFQNGSEDGNRVNRLRNGLTGFKTGQRLGIGP